jgi:hypothetical protein
MKIRITKNRAIIVNAIHIKKLSAFRLFHNERINPSATVKTSLRGVRLFAPPKERPWKLEDIAFGGKGRFTLWAKSQPPGITGQ